ncbi:MAG TPA: hypothetical protein PLQ97_04875 [Myxococcota bacterium]|nr:hypothetical protein [Myxococcota bacterium]HQK51044.1 hypothetical protein [Myxococcota bacterium]
MTRRLAWLLPWFLACEGGIIGGPSPTLDTLLDPTTVKAGDPFSVRCQVYGDGGREAPWPTVMSVAGPGYVDFQEDHATATVVGTYTFTCRAEDLGLVDAEPAVLEVVPADPARVETTVAPGTVKAGEPAQVTCTVLDRFGNRIPDAPTQVEPGEGILVEGFSVRGERVGTYPVICDVPDREVERVPSSLTVVPGDPVRLVVTARPDLKKYSIGSVVNIGWKVYDAFDNEVPDLPATVDTGDAPGMPLVDASTHKYRFAREGRYRVNVTLLEPWQEIGNSKVLVCDTSAPSIEVLWPPRGHTQTGDPALTVRARVTDAGESMIARVTVNGQPATQTPDGTWEATVIGTHGLNPVVVTAKDEWNYETFVTRGWYYSAGWKEVTPSTTLDDAVLPESVLLHLGQRFLDDGDHDPSHPNDLATLVEILLGNTVTQLVADLPPFSFPIPGIINATLLGVGLKGDLEIQVEVTDFALGAPRVDLDLQDGGIGTGITFTPLFVGLRLTFIVHARAEGFGQSIPLLDPSVATSGSLTVGTLGLSLVMAIEKAPGGPLSAEGRDFQLTLQDVALSPVESLEITLGKIPGTSIDLGQVNLDWLVGGINGLLSQYVLNPLINLITQPLIDLLEPLVTRQIGGLLEQVLGMLNIRQTIPLPDLLGTGRSVDLGLALGLSSVQFTEDEGRLGLDLGFLTTKQLPREPPLGSILRAQCDGAEGAATDYVFPADPSVQAGISHDALNQLLFALWWSGMFEGTFDLSALLQGAGGGLPVDNLVVSPILYHPPILNDCGGSGQRLEIGDVFLDLSMDLLGNTQYLEVYLQLSMEADVVATGDQVGLRIGKVRTLEMEIYDVGGGLGDLLGMVQGLIPGLLKNIEGQQFTFPIPAIPLDGLVPGLPPGTSLQLGNLVGGVDRGLLRIGGDLL